MSRKNSDVFAEVIVGIFMVAVLALLAYFTIVISGVDLLLGRAKKSATFVFQDVGGLKERDSVMYRGMKVGAVERIELGASNITVRVKVDSDVVMRETGQASVSALSLLGGNYLLLEEGTGKVKPLETTVFHGEPPVDWMRDIGEIARNLSDLTSEGSLKSIVTNFEETAKNLNLIVARVERGEGTVGKLLSSDNALYSDLTNTVAGARQTFDKAKETFDNAASVSARLEKGEGTLGKLLSKDETAYGDLTNAVASIKETFAHAASVAERLEKGEGGKAKKAGTLKIGVDTLPALPKDATDRNRTSPFAFTGNKFEFRAPGSSVCCSGPMTVLNTIVAEAVDRIAGELEKAKVAGKAKPGEHTPAFHNALQKILQDSLKAHKRVVFNGNGYEAEWPLEAERRGLPNAPDTPSALTALTKKENAKLFEKYGVMTARELESRHEIFLEEYAKKVRIEGACARDIASEMILPAVKGEYLETIQAFAKAESVGVSSGTSALRESAVEIGTGLDALKTGIKKLDEALSAATPSAEAEILSAMQALRTTVDALEKRVSETRWPLPKYRDMLFLY